MYITESSNSSFSQESDFEQKIKDSIHKFWNTREDGYLRTFDKKKLYWCQFTHPDHQRSLLIINGRVESCLKYQEVFFDLFHQGFNIYSYDHRGQGLSERLTEDTQLGHVEFFDDYIQDLDTIIKHFAITTEHQCHILAHSMGGAVAIRYLETHNGKHPFLSLAMTSPMLGFHLSWYLKPVAIPVTQIMASVASHPGYAPGYGAYHSTPFEHNIQSHSPIRYNWFRQLYETQTQLKLGGPSIRWVWQSLMAMKQCYLLTRQLTIPCLLLQADQDRIVKNTAQEKFMVKLRKTNPKTEMHTIEGTRHELLFEQDESRNKVLAQLMSFFCKNNKHQ